MIGIILLMVGDNRALLECFLLHRIQLPYDELCSNLLSLCNVGGRLDETWTANFVSYHATILILFAISTHLDRYA